MKVVGWNRKPYSEDSTHNLEWGIIGEDDQGGRAVNHSSRILGRRGVMRAQLVAGAERINASLAEYREATKRFTFTPENRYTSFVRGDKVAEYGLGALIVGGAAAAAARTGLWKSLIKILAAFWKLILVGVAAVGGMILKLIRGMFSKKDETRDAGTGA